MAPLIDRFTKTLQPCSGCGKSDLSDPIYDQFWKNKQKENDAVHNHKTNSSGSGNPGGSGSEDSGGQHD
jgi:hypothetical protein